MASGRGTSLSFYPFHSHYILLLTWVLAIIGWFVAFIAMCVGEAAVSNTSPTFGSLWFNIFLQLAVMIGFFIAIATDSLPLYQLQLSIFGAVALVFAVDGVRFIYSTDGAQQAVGAGWLILAIVDILWLLFLTSEKPTLFNHLLNHPSISHGNQLVHPSGNRGFAAPHQTAGVGYSSTNTGGGGKRTSSLAEINPSSSTANGFYAGAGGGGGGMSTDHLREHSPLVEMGRGGANGLAAGESQGGLSTSGGSVPGGGQVTKRAKALYAYQASADDPQEISMSKGELFDVLDNSGKWWQVAKLDGSGQSGIAPSNYLQLA